MYTSLKKIAAVSIVLSVINLIATILTVMMIYPLETMTFTMIVAIAGSMFCTSIALIVIGAALWNLHGDLEAHMDATYSDITALKKLVEKLENK